MQLVSTALLTPEEELLLVHRKMRQLTAWLVPADRRGPMLWASIAPLSDD